MFTARPPRTDSPPEQPKTLHLTPLHLAHAAGAFVAVISIAVILLALTFMRYRQRAEHEALMRRTNDVINLLGEESARKYFERQTP